MFNIYNYMFNKAWCL